jgi:hypothetical protein
VSKAADAGSTSGDVTFSKTEAAPAAGGERLVGRATHLRVDLFPQGLRSPRRSRALRR